MGSGLRPGSGGYPVVMRGLFPLLAAVALCAPPSAHAAELGAGPRRVLALNAAASSVPAERVPPAAELLEREPTVWARYRYEVVLVVGGFAFQSVLIALLLLERRRRWAAEAKARENLAVVAHMNRVSAFGELVGSLAHELNSPLGAVLSNAQAAQRLIAAGKPADDADVRGSLADIVRDVKRASEVIRRIRGVLRKEAWDPADLDVRAVIREAYRLVKADARDKGVSVQVDAAPVLPHVNGDEVQIVQVVLNLLLNAIDAVAAMPEDRRHVRIVAKAVGGQMAITVLDSGLGVTPDVAARLFEPFFTTKPVGLGMGLSISRSIIESHGGTIGLQEAPCGGAAFEIRLPAARGSPAPRAHATA
jgi:C4-dicarboxylate-specific signal transduction histidine kinase